MEPIKAIIGLGNPGPRFDFTRHNIGFAIVDALADRHNGSWRTKDNMELTEIRIGDSNILLIKPQTFMNDSGKVIPFLNKKGIKPENVLVVHDELELPFGTIKIKFGGGHRGHNGLRSIIDIAGKDFHRLRFGIGRPDTREQNEVGDYVLTKFSEPKKEVEEKIIEATNFIEEELGK